VGANAEELEKILKIAPIYEGEFELEHGVLAWIDVNSVDLRRVVEQVVEGIATGACDHDNPTVRAKLEQLAIDARILPAGVVDQLSTMNMVENQIVRRLENALGGVQTDFGRHYPRAIHAGRASTTRSLRRCRKITYSTQSMFWISPDSPLWEWPL
jgi:hypothetical protein